MASSASGVMSFEVSRATALASKADPQVPGSRCTTPPGVRAPLTPVRVTISVLTSLISTSATARARDAPGRQRGGASAVTARASACSKLSSAPSAMARAYLSSPSARRASPRVCSEHLDLQGRPAQAAPGRDWELPRRRTLPEWSPRPAPRRGSRATAQGEEGVARSVPAPPEASARARCREASTTRRRRRRSTCGKCSTLAVA